MSDLPILKEIENNPIVSVETLEDNKPVIFNISYRDRKEIIIDYFNGMTPEEISSKWELPVRTVNTIINKSDELRMEVEKRYFAVNVARENVRIADCKNRMIDYVNQTLENAESEQLGVKDRMKTIQNLASVLDKLDKSYRLNNNMPTSSNETTHKVIDVAKIIEQFKTPEEKLEFLQRQNQNKGIETPPTIEGEITEN
jgi:hypothetical protein